MIDAYGSIHQFYKKFFISSICPYGFTLNGKNINYYDDIKLFDKWKNKIVEWIRFQIEHIGLNKTCVIIGKGKNQKFFEMINKEYKFFNNFITLPHPRWILQYKMKMKKEYLDEYVTKLSNIKL